MRVSSILEHSISTDYQPYVLRDMRMGMDQEEQCRRRQWRLAEAQNLTCPHCRVELKSDRPLVPNIMVDQVIERKLQSLPIGVQQTELREDRAIKME